MLCSNTTYLGASIVLNKEVVAMQLTYMISAGPFVISHCCTLCLYVLDLLSKGSVRGERNSLAFFMYVNIYALVCVYQIILHYSLQADLINVVIFWC